MHFGSTVKVSRTNVFEFCTSPVLTRRDAVQVRSRQQVPLFSSCLNAYQDDVLLDQPGKVFQAWSSSSRLEILATSLFRTGMKGSAWRVEMK